MKCPKCEEEKSCYCQECAEENTSKRMGSVAHILVNALRYLNKDELRDLGKKIAELSDSTFIENK